MGVIEFVVFCKSCPNMSFKIMAIVPVSKKNILRYILRSSVYRRFPALAQNNCITELRRENADLQKTSKYISKFFFLIPGL